VNLHLKNLKKIPDDSPFLARTIDEVKDMNKQYTGMNFKLPFWHYKNPRFLTYIALPIAAAALAGIYVTTRNDIYKK